jgi:hypothetical protein
MKQPNKAPAKPKRGGNRGHLDTEHQRAAGAGPRMVLERSKAAAPNAELVAIAVAASPGKTRFTRQDWEDAKCRYEIARADLAEHELAAARGRWCERSELDATARLMRDLFWSEMQHLDSLVLAELSDLPLEVRARIKDAVGRQVIVAAGRVQAAGAKLGAQQ